MGDFNAKIEKEAIRQFAGKFYLHEVTSDYGLLFVQFPEIQRMIIKNNYFLHKQIHRGTWKIQKLGKYIK